MVEFTISFSLPDVLCWRIQKFKGAGDCLVTGGHKNFQNICRAYAYLHKVI